MTHKQRISLKPHQLENSSFSWGIKSLLYQASELEDVKSWKCESLHDLALHILEWPIKMVKRKYLSTMPYRHTQTHTHKFLKSYVIS